jgi:hypothetical protein
MTDRTIADTWRDPDADSGLRLDHWLSESEDRDVVLRRWRDSILGPTWTVDLLDGGQRVASGRDRHLDDAWTQALRALAKEAEREYSERVCQAHPSAVAS